MMMRRPVNELASRHHSGSLLPHSTVAHKPDSSYRDKIPTPDGLLRKGQTLLQVQCLIWKFMSCWYRISVYTCSRVNAKVSGRGWHISNRKLYFCKNANVCLQQLYSKFLSWMPEIPLISPSHLAKSLLKM